LKYLETAIMEKTEPKEAKEQIKAFSPELYAEL
jgi:hypothetical protein